MSWRNAHVTDRPKLAFKGPRLVEPREIADAVAFLASPRSASTTGTELVVDGGMLKAG